MTNKQQMLMHSITQFFESNNDLFMEFYDIVKPTSKISLRVIDWFITNYSRVNDVSYQHPTKPDTMFSVHDSYKSQLKAYSKRQFDPFCRRMRINFHFSPTDKVVTTVGQLNFFRWAIETGVMRHIRENFEIIEKHMKTYVRESRETKRNQSSQCPQSQEDSGMDELKMNIDVSDIATKAPKNIAGGGQAHHPLGAKSRRRNTSAKSSKAKHTTMDTPTTAGGPSGSMYSSSKTQSNNIVLQKKNHTVYFH
jgi:hypothetical protein